LTSSPCPPAEAGQALLPGEKGVTACILIKKPLPLGGGVGERQVSKEA